MRRSITVFAGNLVFLMWGEKSFACTPTPNFTSSATSICQGQSVNFTSTGGAGTPAATSWTWTFPGGTPGTSTAQHPAGIVYNTPGVYDVTHTATNTYTPPTGTTTKTAYITVLSSSGTPVVNLGADIPNACPSATLDAGNPGHSYLWSTGATTKTITVTVTGTYSVTVTNSCSGNSASDDINVTFTAAPFTVDLGNDITTCNGNSVFLDAGNPGVGTTYLWSTGATTQTLTVTTAGAFSVTATRCGTSASDDINITLNTPPCNSAPSLLWAQSIGGYSGTSDEASDMAIDAAGNIYVTGTACDDIVTIKYDASGAQQWLATYNGPGSGIDKPNAIVLDGSGNVYVTGYATIGGVQGTDYVTIKYNSSGAEQWAVTHDGAVSDANWDRDAANDIAVDGSGNVYVTGNLCNTTGCSQWPYDIRTVKYNSSGTQQWAATYSTSCPDFGNAITVDGSGNVYITGQSSQTSNSRFITIKYNSSGAQQWVQQAGDGSSWSSESGAWIQVDGSGNVYVAGSLRLCGSVAGCLGWQPAIVIVKYNASGVLQWQTQPYSTVPCSEVNKIFSSAVMDGSGNIYVAGSTCVSCTASDFVTLKYNNSGAKLWETNYNGTAGLDDFSTDIAIDGSGNVFVSGRSFNTADDYATVKYNSSGTQQWAIAYDGTAGGNDYANASAVDASGNVYITGTVQNFGSGTDYGTIKYNSAGAQQWVVNYNCGYSASTITDQAVSCALDASGNMIIAGDFTGRADFDPGAGSSYLYSCGNSDIFMAGYDGSGNYLWGKNLYGNGSEKVGNMVLNGGNIYIAGTINGTTDFDPGAGVANLVSGSSGGNDIYFAKYDNSGNYQWAKCIVGVGASYDADKAMDMKVDASGNIYITGTFEGTADFDPGAGTAYLTTSGVDMYIAKYNSSGNFVWAKKTTNSVLFNVDISRSIAIDGAGNIFITGRFRGTVDFGGGNNCTSSVNDIFFAKYDNNGNCLWAKNLGNTSADEGYSIALDGTGNIILTGIFYNIVDFDPGAGVANLQGDAPNSVFIAKYDNNGNYIWAKKMAANTYPVKIVQGSIYMAGYYAASSDFDPDPAIISTIPTAGSNDVFFAKYDDNANLLWVKGVGGAGDDRNLGIAADGSGNVFIAGFFNNTSDFDPGAGTYNLTSVGSGDIFFAKYGQGAGLPIELLSFTGYNAGDKNILEWSTATEINNDYFTVECSSLSFGELVPTIREGWAEAGIVKGAGNSSSIRNYEFVDISPLSFGEGSGVRFYRLKQTDFDGQYSYSNIIAIKTKESAQTISIFPNPVADGQINVLVSGNEQSEISIEILDITGRAIISQTKSLQKGTNKIKVDVSWLNSGIYYLCLSTESGLSHGEKIMVIK